MLAAGLFYCSTILGGLIGTNNDWQEPEQGVTIYVETNGFHTGLILPAQAEGIDWHALFPPDDSPFPPLLGNYVAIGWGQRDFYLETEQIADIKISTFIKAAIGSNQTLMHVYHLRDPRPGQYVRELRITHDAYRQIARDIQASTKIPVSGPLTPIRGYGGNDVFYEARGNYSLINSCNSWTGRILRNAGIRVGAWTPSENSVMRWFPMPSDDR